MLWSLWSNCDQHSHMFVCNVHLHVLNSKLHETFTVRCYASAVYAIARCLTVCVCLPVTSWSLLKWLNGSSWFLVTRRQFLPLLLCCVIRKFECLQNKGTSSGFTPNSVGLLRKCPWKVDHVVNEMRRRSRLLFTPTIVYYTSVDIMP